MGIGLGALFRAPITCLVRWVARRWEPFPPARVTAQSPDPSLPPRARHPQPSQTLHLAFQAPTDSATLGPATAWGAGAAGEPHTLLGHAPHVLSFWVYTGSSKRQSGQCPASGPWGGSGIPSAPVPPAEVLGGFPPPKAWFSPREGWLGACRLAWPLLPRRALSSEPLARVLPSQAARPQPVPSTAGNTARAPLMGTLGCAPAGLHTALPGQAGCGAPRRWEGGKILGSPSPSRCCPLIPLPNPVPRLVCEKKQTFRNGWGTHSKTGDNRTQP